ncbi:F-box/LRR-repeat protein At3g26922-like [Bidens hawaiensis]|uniref:F-box/LRR-repeat protein At3g26922-like n=1 Tax=Bidens hawaiensis TaxID=980011 RepID=UPI00404A6470
MDMIHDETSNIEDEEEENEDRNRNLPDDIIHHIISFLDMKYVVQTSALSHRWEPFWKSTDHLSLNCHEFRTQTMFSKFVKHVLSHRRNDVALSKVQLTVTGSARPSVVKSVVNYAFQHNVTELNMTWIARAFFRVPECLFSSHTLKHLTLAVSKHFIDQHEASCLPNLVWDFPALETVFMSNLHFGRKGEESLDFFSKCLNLRDLTLHKCCMFDLKIFNICVPELSNLTITDFMLYPDAFKVVAPKLKNLTAAVKCSFMIESPQLSSEGLDSLEKVNLSLSMPYYKPLPYFQERFVPVLLNLFPKLRSTKFLVVSLDIIETLSLCLDQLSHEPCPFDNLKCLKINMASRKQEDHIATVPTQVRNYFLENSPSATFIMDFPQK